MLSVLMAAAASTPLEQGDGEEKEEEGEGVVRSSRTKAARVMAVRPVTYWSRCCNTNKRADPPPLPPVPVPTVCWVAKNSSNHATTNRNPSVVHKDVLDEEGW